MNFLFPLDKFIPDTIPLGNSGMGYVQNVIPFNGVYSPSGAFGLIRQLASGPSPTFTNIQGDIAGVKAFGPIALLAVENGATGYKLFASDFTGWQEGDIDRETDVTPAAATWAIPSSADVRKRYGVQFATVGNVVYCCNGHSNIHNMNVITWLGTHTTNFIENVPAIGSATIKCRDIEGHAGHLFAAGIKFGAAWNGYANNEEQTAMLWWSAFGDGAAFGNYAFTPQLKGTDNRILYETQGPITAIVSAGEVLYAFKESSIYIVEGPPFRVSLLVSNVGTSYPNSLFYHEHWVYFFTDNGPARVSAQGQVEYVFSQTANRVLGSAFDGLSAYDTGACGFFDFANKDISHDWYLKGYDRLITASASLQYQQIYFSYPSRMESGDKPHQRVCVFDALSQSVGYLNPIPEGQTGADTAPTSAYNMSMMFSMEKTYNDRRGNIFMIGPKESSEAITGYKSWYEFSPWKTFGVSTAGGGIEIITRFFRPPVSAEGGLTRITKFRPLLKIGYGSSNYNASARLWTINDYIQDEITLFGAPSETSSYVSSDGFIVFDDSKFGIEHCIGYLFDTNNGATTTSYAKYMTCFSLFALEIHYEEQGTHGF